MMSAGNDVGAANAELGCRAHVWWCEAAERAGFNMSDFDPSDNLPARKAWATRNGLDLGTVYSRFSSKRQHSTDDQIRTCVQHAAANRIYCPPEFICVDEGQRGYKARRVGLDRMRGILRTRQAGVLLVFKASRLYRQAFKGYQLIQQEVVEENLRAISVTQSIDTSDTKAWRMLFQVHGIVDDMVVESTSDHVRAGLAGLFVRKFTVGALPVGYRRKELPTVQKTNRGLTRTVPEIDSDAAKMIVQHFELIRDGLSIQRGWKKWVEDRGPYDPRAITSGMTRAAYRRMLSRVSYIGTWEFGRRRNEFSTKKDYSRQILQEDSKVETLQCEELRIVDNELFYAVQARLAGLTTGPRGPRKKSHAQLSDIVTELFWCPKCNVRFYQAGADGKAMQCKNGLLCPHKSTVRRDEAVRQICRKLCELVKQDADLIENAVCRVQQLEQSDDKQLQADRIKLEKNHESMTKRIAALYELFGECNDDNRREIKAAIKVAQADRTATKHKLCQLEGQIGNPANSISPEEVRALLNELDTVLTAAATGGLGDEAVNKAVAIFRVLVGERIWVHVEARPGRKRTNVRGVFQPQLVKAIECIRPLPSDSTVEGREVTVFLRQPPRLDLIAERVHQLIDEQGLSHRATAAVLQQEGHKVNAANVWCSYRRWYEMQGKEAPRLPYNNGEQRKSR